MENIAKSTSYGCYLDCDFETAKYPDDKTHIVGLLAEYVYDLEQRILHYDERYIKLWNEIETLRECVSKEFDQEQQIADLEEKIKALQNGIIDDETLNMLVKEHKLYKDLEAKLAESEKSKESYRLQNEQHHLQLLQFYSRLGVEAFGADIHEKALETLMIMKEQLVESEKKAYSRGHSQRDIANEIKLNALREDVANKEKRIVELKQQLEENNKQIKTYAHEIAFLDKKIANIKNSCDYYMKRANDLVLKQNQKAIEQLEKVKEHFINIKTPTHGVIRMYEMVMYIDNQIKQLKDKNNG